MLLWVTPGAATPGVSWGSGRLAGRAVVVVVEVTLPAWEAGNGTVGSRSRAAPAKAPRPTRTTITAKSQARALRASTAPTVRRPGAKQASSPSWQSGVPAHLEIG